MAITLGKIGHYRTVVPEEHTAHTLGNDGVHVLASPILGLYCELACHHTIKDDFADGQSSVGIHLDIHHLAATAVGEWVEITAEITEIDGKRLVFALTGRDRHRQVVKGLHERVLVDLDAFLAKLPKPPTG